MNIKGDSPTLLDPHFFSLVINSFKLLFLEFLNKLKP